MNDTYNHRRSQMQLENDSVTTQAVVLICTNTTREGKFIADFCAPPLAAKFAKTISYRTVKINK